MLLNIDHFTICAPYDQLERLKTFYTKVLGLTVAYRPPLKKHGYWLTNGNQTVLHLSEDNTVVVGQTGGCFDHIAFRCQGLDDMLKSLNNHQIDYELRELSQLTQIQIFFRDPCGIRIELNFLNESVK